MKLTGLSGLNFSPCQVSCHLQFGHPQWEGARNAVKVHADAVETAHGTGAVVRHKVQRAVGPLLLAVLVVALQKQLVVVVVIAVIGYRMSGRKVS